jgi:ribosome maturation factor RimP
MSVVEQQDRARARIQKIAEEILGGMGLELVEVCLVPGRRPQLCVYIDGPDGVTVDHCARLSRGISRQLEEEEDLLSGPFRLEVSSPGLDRPFAGLADFYRNVGRSVEARLKEARPGGVERLVGILQGADEQGFDLLQKDGDKVHCSHDEVRKVHRAIEF